jgi:antitoxin component YwqK of YwqJK toxin-antitoxin module
MKSLGLSLALGFLFYPILWAGETVYLSNEVGMPIAPYQAGEGERPEYLLFVEQRKDTVVRRLLNREGEESKRWEIRLDTHGNLVESKEYKNGLIRLHLFYNAYGKVVREIQYTDGREEGSFEYQYQGNRYTGVTYQTGNTGEDYVDKILYTPGGKFRGVRREYRSGKSLITLFSLQDDVLSRELYQGDTVSILVRYNSIGLATLQEVRNRGELTERTIFRYSEKDVHVLREKEVENFTTGVRTIFTFDANGYLVREVQYQKGIRILETNYVYNQEDLVRKETRTRTGFYRWEYSYSEDGKMMEERHYENGELRLQIDYSPLEPYTKVESRFKNNFLVLRSYFQEETEVRVEYYKEGKLLRSVERASP